jgi:hypothetical protein
MDAAKLLVIVGAAGYILAGAGHAALALWDGIVRPRFFTPIDDRVRPVTDRTGIRFRELFPGSPDRPTMWRAWLGFNISHGLGLTAFGLILLLLAATDFSELTDTGGLMPVALAVSTGYLALGLWSWFYVPALLAGLATTCFAVAWALTL